MQEANKTIRLGLSNISKTKPPFLDWDGTLWRVWTSYNNSLSSGTYIVLNNDGSMERVTIQDGQHIETVLL